MAKQYIRWIPDHVHTAQWHHNDIMAKQYTKRIIDNVHTGWGWYSHIAVTSWQTVYKMDYWSCLHTVKTAQSQHNDIMAKQYIRCVTDHVHTGWRQYSLSTVTSWQNNTPEGLLTVSTHGEDSTVVAQWQHGKQNIRIIDNVHTGWGWYSHNTVTAWKTKYKAYWQCPHMVKTVQ